MTCFFRGSSCGVLVLFFSLGACEPTLAAAKLAVSVPKAGSQLDCDDQDVRRGIARRSSYFDLLQREARDLGIELFCIPGAHEPKLLRCAALNQLDHKTRLLVLARMAKYKIIWLGQKRALARPMTYEEIAPMLTPVDSRPPRSGG